MKIRLISFTDRGQNLAEKLAEQLRGEAMRCRHPLSLQEWTAQAFREADALVFVGAAGIAVRAVAPYVANKTKDPAVVAVDECGRFSVSLLSGHLGGANDLARKIAQLCGAVPVITTATDAAGVFSIDAWARMQGCAVRNPDKIRSVSASLLAGSNIRIRSDYPVEGELPEGVELTEKDPCDAALTIRENTVGVLQIIPKIVVIGIGCRKGTSAEALESAYLALLSGEGICEEAVSMAATIDRKAEEPGLLAFCASRGLPLINFPAEELSGTEGEFTSSDFVRVITGVDNVCERSAVLGSRGVLIVRKRAGKGITMAAAVKPFRPDWRWQSG